MGADAVLLIVAALSDAELAELSALAGRLGLDALVEVHDDAELDRALDAGARLVGVNQRDLSTFEVDRERAVRLAAEIPGDVVAVAESGIGGPADAGRLAAAGYQAVLVGETLVRAGDRSAAVAALAGHPVAARPRPSRWDAAGRDAGRERRGTPDGARRAAPISWSRSAGSPPRPTPCWPWAWGPTPSASSSPPRPARWPRPRWPTSSSASPTSVLTVGVFRDEAPRRVVEIANQIGLGAVQLHGHETAEEYPVGAPAGALHHQGLPGRRPRPSAASPSSGPTTC